MTPQRPPTSWDEVAHTYSSPIYLQAYRMTGNRADAEDLAQDVFVRAFQALHTSKPLNMGAWLRRIARNLYLDRIRHQRVIQFVALPDPDAQSLVDPEPQPPDALVGRSLDLDVRHALNALSADTRRAVILSDIDDLSHDEIAAITGVSRGTVKSRIHRGRRQLRAALADSSSRSCADGTRQ